MLLVYTEPSNQYFTQNEIYEVVQRWNDEITVIDNNGCLKKSNVTPVTFLQRVNKGKGRKVNDMVKIEEITNKVNEKYGVVEVFIKDEFQRVFKGKAKCASDDKYDFDFGEKLAYLRAKKKMLKVYEKEQKNLYKASKASFDNYEQRVIKELNNYTKALNNIDEKVNEMISQ